MPDTPQAQSTSASSPTKRSRPPGELGGHTVMPWEQGESTQGRASSHIPAGGDAATPASGGSSKSVPPPSGQRGKDGLGQGAGASTAKAADDRMPSAPQSVGRPPTSTSVSSRPPPGSAGKPARPNARSRPQELESQHPEGAEWPLGSGQDAPETATEVGLDDAPADAMAGAPRTAHKATPQASKDTPEDQVEGGDETRAAQAPSPPDPAAKRPVTPALSGTRPKPDSGEVEEVSKASAPHVPSGAAGAAPPAAAHPTHPDRRKATGQDPRDDALIEAIDRRLADMLARALHETVATAVRETLRSERPPAPPPVQPAKKA
ncbi:MAG TPA: hypothetical protein VHI93_09110 [Candidatus Thermoplasmatota archaeon]|nr:hypothetical protein [Candidatus Thermoplasmatota archaeon]